MVREGDSGNFNELGLLGHDATTYTINGLLPGRYYNFQILAVRDCNLLPELESPSPIVTGWTVPSKTIIRPDQSVSTATNSLTLAWDAQSCSVWYINIATDPGFVNVVGEYNRGVNPPANNTGVITRTYNDFLPGTNYYYQMRAYSAWFLEGAYSGGSPAIPTRPETPSAATVAPADQTLNSFVARWTANNGNATKYYLDVAPTNAFATRLPGYDGKEVTPLNQEVSGLVPGSQYYFRVKAATSKFTTPYSSTIGVRLKPQANDATNVTTNSFDISWAQAQNISGYQLDVSTSSGFGSYVPGYEAKPITASQTKVDGLKPGTVYYARMRTMLGTVPSAQSNVVTVLTTPELSATTDIGTTSVQLNWVQGASPDGYLLDVATDEAFNNKLSGYNGQGVSGISRVVAGLTPGVRYFYRLRTLSGAMVSPNSQAGSAYTLTLAPQVEPVTQINTQDFTATWPAIANAQSYRIDLAFDDGFTQFVDGFSNVEVSGITYQATGLVAGTQYYLRVRSINSGGAPSANSTTVPVKTRSQAPEVSVQSFTTNSMVLNWSAIIGAETYRLDVATSSDFQPGTFVGAFNDFEIASTNASYSVTGLLSGTQYYIRMRARNVGGYSEYSEVVPQSTLTLAPVWKDNFTSLTDRITIDWNAVIGAESYEIEVSANSNFSTLLPGFNPKVLDATNTSVVVPGLSPLTVYYFRIRARNNAGLSALSFTKSASTLNADGRKPEIEMSFAPFENSAVIGQTSRRVLSLTASSQAGAVTVDFFHKKRSEQTFTRVPLSLDQGKFTITTNDDWFDKFGMEFYFQVQDLLSQTKREPASGSHVIFTAVESFSVPVARHGAQATDYVIVSFPYILPKTTIEDILVPVVGEYNRNAWRFVRYEDGNNKDYQNDGLRLRDIAQGEGYWFLTKEPVNLTFTNGRTYPNSITAPFVMRLRRGWNQIGNPFPYSLSWNDVLADNNNPTAVGDLHVFSGQPNQFPESDQLQVFGGGFVFSDENADLVFKVTLPEFRAGRTGRKPITFEQTPNEWFLPIALEQGDVKNTVAGIGMSPLASDGKDRYDKVTTPRFGSYLELNSRVRSFEYDLSLNVVKTANQHQWDLTLESNGSEPVELTWDSELVQRLDAQMLLWDLGSGEVVNMANVNSYTAPRSAEIRILYTTHPVNTDLPLARIGHPHPVPFREQVTIPVAYVLDQNLAVGIQIIDTMGRPIYEATATSRENGLFCVTWNGKTIQGAESASGLYLFKITGIDANGRIIDYEGKLIKE